MSYDEDFAEEECTKNGAAIRNDYTISHNVISKQFSRNKNLSHYFLARSYKE